MSRCPKSRLNEMGSVREEQGIYVPIISLENNFAKCFSLVSYSARDYRQSEYTRERPELGFRPVAYVNTRCSPGKVNMVYMKVYLN